MLSYDIFRSNQVAEYPARQVEQVPFKEEKMKVRVITLSLAITLGIFLSLLRHEISFAKDNKPTPKEVVAAHLKSIGDPELLARIKTRGMSGSASVEFIQGGVGTLAGQGLVVTEGHSLSIIMNFGNADYPREYFAFDGTDVDVATISPGQRSPLGEFVFRYDGLMKEGLLAGVYSLGWPLLDIEKREASLKYRSAEVDGRELHQIEYNPKGGLNNIKVKLFFEPDTYHHVRTEYSLKVEGEMALQDGRTIAGGGDGTSSRSAGILDPIANSYYQLVEKFDNFKRVRFRDPVTSEINSLTLPHSYTLEYSVEGHGTTFVGHWNLVANEWMQDGTLDPSIFKVP